MIKKGLNYKLVNICLIILILFLLYKTGSLWTGMIRITGKIILPFFLAFTLAYALNPALRWMNSKGIPKGISIFLILLIIVGMLFMVMVLLVPLLFNQIEALFKEILVFIMTISIKFNIDFEDASSSINNLFNTFLENSSKYIPGGAINFVNISINYITIFFIFISSSIYFLIDMDNIRCEIKRILSKINNSAYKLIYNIDLEMKKYFTSFIKIMIITFFEYNLGFILIGHPNFLLLGFLASISSVIPYFGGIIVNIIAGVCAFVISKSLFIKTIILIFVLSMIDGYVIGPLVYGKSNKIHPLLSIFAVFMGGIVFGILGIIISMPLCIILLTIYRFFKDDICDKIKKETSLK